MIAENAERLGTPRLRIVPGDAPQSLAGQPAPDAVFIGGGLGEPGVFETAWAALKPGGRMVVNVVTLEGELHLIDLHEKHGGDLVRIEVSHLTHIGALRALKPRMPVLQWRTSSHGEEGTLYGLGVGPGDPGTDDSQGLAHLSTAPVIAYLAANGRTARRAASPVRSFPDDALELAFDVPMRTEREPAQRGL